jgi:hypothetical protein
MDRTAVIVIPVVVLAAGLFGLTFLSGGSKDPSPGGRGERYDPQGARYASGRSGGNGTLPGGELGPIRGGGEKSGASGRRGTGFKRGNRAAGHTRGDGRQGANVQVSPSGSVRSGALGSLTARSRLNSATVGIEEGRVPEQRDQVDARRGDVVDYLSKQPLVTSVDGILGPDGEVEEDDGVELPPAENEALDFPVEASTQDKGGALKFEIEPDWDGTSDAYQSFIQITSGPKGSRLELYKGEEGLLYLVFWDDAGNERRLLVPVRNWVAGERHTVGATWQTGELEFLVDGFSVGKAAYPGKLEFGDESKIFVGQAATHMHKVESAGVIENFKLYPRSLSEDDR